MRGTSTAFGWSESGSKVSPTGQGFSRVTTLNGCACQDLLRGVLKPTSIVRFVSASAWRSCKNISMLGTFRVSSRWFEGWFSCKWWWTTNPKHPDFIGLGVLVDATTTSSSAARVPRFTSWVTARQRTGRDIRKRRLYVEEQLKTQKTDWHGGAESKRAPKPKPKPKAS